MPDTDYWERTPENDIDIEASATGTCIGPSDRVYVGYSNQVRAYNTDGTSTSSSLDGLTRNTSDDHTLSGISTENARGFCWWDGYWRLGEGDTIYAFTSTFARSSANDITLPSSVGDVRGLTTDGTNLIVLSNTGSGIRLVTINTSVTITSNVAIATPTGYSGAQSIACDTDNNHVWMGWPRGISETCLYQPYSLAGATLSGQFNSASTSNSRPAGMVWYNGYLIVSNRAGQPFDRFFAYDLSDNSLVTAVDDSTISNSALGLRNDTLYVVGRGTDTGIDAWDIDHTDNSEDTASGFNLLTSGLRCMFYHNNEFYLVFSNRQVQTSSSGGSGSFLFNLDSDNSNPTGMFIHNSRIYVADATADKVFVYSLTGSRESGHDFDLAALNGNCGGLTYIQEHVLSLDDSDDKVYTYDINGTHTEDNDLEETENLGAAITGTGNTVYVRDVTNDRLRAYNFTPLARIEMTITSQYDIMGAFEVWSLHEDDPIDAAANVQAACIGHEGKLYAASGTTVYVYNTDGSVPPTGNFSLLTSGIRGMAFHNSEYYTVHSNLEVHTYSSSGGSQGLLFSLDSGNSNPTGMYIHDSRIHVCDSADEKVYVYSLTGQRQSGREYDLVTDSSPRGMAFIQDHALVLENSTDSITAYTESGTHVPLLDFDPEESISGAMAGAGELVYIYDDAEDQFIIYRFVPFQRVEQTVPSEYEIIGRKRRTITSLYELIGRKALTVQSEYGILDDIGRTRTSVYGILTGRGRRRRSQYNLLGQAASTHTSEYGLLGRILQTHASEYNILRSIYRLRRSMYNILDSVASTITSEYAIRVVASIINSFLSTFNVETRRHHVRTSEYNILFPLSRVRTSVYGIIRRVDRIRTSEYNILSGMGRTLESVYDILMRVGRRRRARYNILGRAAATTTSEYGILRGIAQTLTSTFNILSLISIMRGFDSTFNLAARIASTKTSGYGIIERLTQTITSTYDMIAGAWVRVASGDFALDADNDDPTGLAYFNNLLLVTDATDHDITTYRPGTGNQFSTLDLDSNNADPAGLVYRSANTTLYVVDGADMQIYVYPDLAFGSTISLDSDNSNPVGLALDGEILFVPDGSAEKVFAYDIDGTRVPECDFDLDSQNDTPTGITHTEGRFLVLDQTNGVFAYHNDGTRATHDDHSDADSHGTGIAANGNDVWIVGFDATIHKYSFTTTFERLVRFIKSQYTMLARIATTPTSQYMILGRVMRTRTSEYHIRERIAYTLTSQYSLLARVMRTITSEYDLKSILAILRSFNSSFNLFARRTSDTVSEYSLLGRLQRTLTSQYDTLRSAVRTITSQFILLEQVDQTLTSIYDILMRIGRRRRARYRIIGRVMGTTTSEYTLYGRIARTLASAYHILSLISIARSIDSTFNLIARRTRTATSQYSLAARINRLAEGSYNVLARFGRTITSEFNIVSILAVVKSILSTYNLIARVGKTTTSRYGLLERVARTATSQFAILNSRMRDIASEYGIVTGIVQTLTSAYDILGRAAADITSMFGIFGRALRTLRSQYEIDGIRARVTGSEVAELVNPIVILQATLVTDMKQEAELVNPNIILEARQV